MFQKKIAKNSVVSNGMNRSLSSPSIGIATFSRTNWMPVSARLCSLPGTTCGRRSARPKNAMNRMNPSKTRNVTKFRQSVTPAMRSEGPQQGHTKSFVVGGSNAARMPAINAGPPSTPWGTTTGRR